MKKICILLVIGSFVVLFVENARDSSSVLTRHPSTYQTLDEDRNSIKGIRSADLKSDLPVADGKIKESNDKEQQVNAILKKIESHLEEIRKNRKQTTRSSRRSKRIYQAYTNKLNFKKFMSLLNDKEMIVIQGDYEHEFGAGSLGNGLFHGKLNAIKILKTPLKIAEDVLYLTTEDAFIAESGLYLLKRSDVPEEGRPNQQTYRAEFYLNGQDNSLLIGYIEEYIQVKANK